MPAMSCTTLPQYQCSIGSAVRASIVIGRSPPFSSSAIAAKANGPASKRRASAGTVARPHFLASAVNPFLSSTKVRRVLLATVHLVGVDNLDGLRNRVKGKLHSAVGMLAGVFERLGDL